ncbi:MAG: AAA family ATPase, partial [Rickettsiales bacterium]
KELALATPDNKAQLESRKIELEKDMKQRKDSWAAHKEEIYKQIRSISDNEESLNKARRELDAELKKAETKNNTLKASATKEKLAEEPKKGILASIGLSSDFDSSFIIESKETKILRENIRIYEQGIDQQNKNLAELTSKYSPDIILNSDDIKKLFSDEAKIPLKKLGVDETNKYLNAEKELSESVIAQEEAVSVVAGSLRRVKAGLKKPNKPIGSFFFLGPSGVGKTELAKALAMFMHGDQKSLIRIDMSEYKDRSSIARLLGAAPGLVGYEEGGILTNAIQRNPYSIVCMDEVEKAHPDVYDILLQLLDEGRLTDGKGITADFTNAVIICTSNYGAKHFLRNDISFSEASAIVKQALYNGDDYHNQDTPFRPEFLNRFTKITCFNRLSIETIQEIASKHIAELGKVINSNYPHLTLEMSDSDMKAFAIANYEDPAKGARIITENAIPNKIGDRLAEAILSDLANQHIDANGDNIEPQPKIIRITYSQQNGVVMQISPKKDTLTNG